jgi:hypothetical protein
MSELHRLRATSEHGYLDLVLTETHVDLAPSEAWLSHLKRSFAEGREGTEAAPGVINWIVNKAMDWADNYVDKVLEPHPLSEVELRLAHDRLSLKLGRVTTNLGDMTVDPTEAYIFDFDAKFREAKAKLQK